MELCQNVATSLDNNSSYIVEKRKLYKSAMCVEVDLNVNSCHRTKAQPLLISIIDENCKMKVNKNPKLGRCKPVKDS